MASLRHASAVLFLVGCGSGAITDSDASSSAADADPNAPDADPFAPDSSVAPSGLCPALADPTGPTVVVQPGESIAAAVSGAAAGTTVLIANGTYDVSANPIWFNAPNVTLRSMSGDRGAVILDGNYNDTGSGGILNIRVSDITIADITLRESRFHAIHVSGSDSATTEGTRIYNVHIIDPGEQAIKINVNVNPADNGEVACSRIELTADGQAFVTSQTSSGSNCYTGGIDAHDAMDWVVRDNWIEGFWCPGDGGQYLSEHAVHFWTGSRGTLVERNMLVNNVRGVGFGLGPGGRSYGDSPCGGENNAGHYLGVIRNNFIVATDPDLFASGNGVQEGISLWSACGATVLHNSIAFSQSANAAIEWRFGETSAVIANNIATDRLWDRGASATLTNNIADSPTDAFENIAAYNLHLASGTAAIDGGTAAYLDLAGFDIDNDPRDDGSPDVGADER